jgi:hypothetical protein
MTPEISKHLSQFAVRLSTKKTVCGSGVIAYTNPQKNLIYIVTAKHCLFNKSGEIKPDITVDFCNSSNNTFQSVKPDNILLPSENSDYDIAILIISDNLIHDLFKVIPPILLSNTIPQTETSYYFRGFPIGSAGFPENLSCLYSDDLSKILKLIPKSPLETNTTVALSNVSNFSGSGVWVKHDDTFYLVGIVTDFKTTFSGFECEKIFQINSILDSENGYPKIDFFDILSIQIQKSSYSQIRQIINQRLNRIEILINTFMPDVALNEIELIKPIIQLHSQDKNKHLAKCYYLEALGKASSTKSYESENIDELFKKAVELEPDSIVFKERLILIHVRNNQKEEALRISQEIIIEDSLNIRAGAFIDAYHNDLKSPQEIIKTPIYKNFRITLINHFNDNSEKSVINLGDIRPFVEEDFKQLPIPEKGEIVRENISYLLYLLQYALHQYFSKFEPIKSEDYRKQFHPHAILDYSYNKLLLIMQTVENTQMVNSTEILILKCRYLHLDYIINGNQISILKLYEEFRKPDVLKTNWLRQIDVIQSLFVIEEYDKIFEIIELLPTVFPAMYLICADAAAKKEDKDLAIKYHLTFLDSILEVESNDIPNIRHSICTLREIYKCATDEIIRRIDKWTFQGGNFKTIILGIVYHFFSNEKEKAELSEIVDDLAAIIDTSEIAFEVIVPSLFRLNRFKELKNYLKPRVQFEESVNKVYLYFYLISLFESLKLGNEDEEDSLILLEGLSYWRKNCSPDFELLQIELKISDVDILNKPSLVEEVAVYGMQHFPNQHWFVFKKVEAIFRQNKGIINSNDFDDVFNEKLLTLNIQPEHLMQIGIYTIGCGKKDLGLEICFQAAIKNTQIKRLQTYYLFNPIINDCIKDITQPNLVGLGCVVRFTLDRKNYILLIDEEAIANNKNVKYVLGKEEGECFEINDFQKGNTKHFRIDNIFNKYEGYRAIIFKDINNDDSQYDGIQLLNFEEKDGHLDINKFDNTLKELRGLDGTKRQLIVKEGIEKFENYQIGFNTFINYFEDPLVIYRHLTTQSFFPIMPLVHHPIVEINVENEFVLDFSSLFLLCDMSNEINFDFSSVKFIISQFMMDFITEKIAELEMDKEGVSMSVTHERVIPIFNREDFFEKLRIEYEALLDWIKKYCKVDNNVNRLSILIQLAQNENITRKKDNLNSAYTDALLLSDDENRVFLTNDIITLQTYFAGRGYKVSCECFLERLFPENISVIKAYLISKNYRGITVTTDILWNIYAKDSLMNVWSDFNKCVAYSLSENNPNPKNLGIIILFLKRLCLESNLDNHYRVRIMKQMFKSVFTGNHVGFDELHEAKILLQKEFSLMPIQSVQILTVMGDMIEDLNLERSMNITGR